MMSSNTRGSQSIYRGRIPFPEDIDCFFRQLIDVQVVSIPPGLPNLITQIPGKGGQGRGMAGKKTEGFNIKRETGRCILRPQGQVPPGRQIVIAGIDLG
jgi:hypothetical protein